MKSLFRTRPSLSGLDDALRKKLPMGFSLAAAAFVGFVLVYASDGLGADGKGPPGDVTFTKILDRNDPTITQDQARRAQQIALAAPELARMSGAAAPRVESAVPWVANDMTPIGAVVKVRLAQPFVGAIAVPVIDYSNALDAYTTTDETFQFAALNTVYVHVDLGSGKAVGFTPGPETEFRPAEAAAVGDRPSTLER